MGFNFVSCLKFCECTTFVTLIWYWRLSPLLDFLFWDTCCFELYRFVEGFVLLFSSVVVLQLQLFHPNSWNSCVISWFCWRWHQKGISCQCCTVWSLQLVRQVELQLSHDAEPQVPHGDRRNLVVITHTDGSSAACWPSWQLSCLLAAPGGGAAAVVAQPGSAAPAAALAAPAEVVEPVDQGSLKEEKNLVAPAAKQVRHLQWMKRLVG